MTRRLVSLCALFCCLLAASPTLSAAAKKPKNESCVSVCDLRVEHLTEPMEIGTTRPRLGWRIESASNDVRQVSCHIIVATTAQKAESGIGDLWDATLQSAQSQWIDYGGLELGSDTRCFWRVNVVTNKGETGWSNTASWNVGLLEEVDWRGQWIGLDKANSWDREDVHSRLSSRYLRHEFELDAKEISSATLYICGLGLYEAYINGCNLCNIGSDKPRVLQPAPTDYRRTVLYNAYDVTPLIHGGNNAIGVVLGNGRFYTMQQNKKTYKIVNFGYPKMRANLIVHYADGTIKTIASDNRWKLNADGPLRSSNEYDGEIYDARKEFAPSWTNPGFDDAVWQRAERVGAPYGTLRPQQMPGMKISDSLKPLYIRRVGSSFVADFGENMAGWIAIDKMNLELGDTVSIRYAEQIDARGALLRDNLRHALSTDIYISNGKRNQSYRPTFVYHGFRYVEISGLKDLTLSDLRAEKVGDEMLQTGYFHCSDSTINAVYANAVRGIAANYKGMPVDCPQRDERQPWLGDRTAGSTGEAFIFDNHALYVKWMRDIAEAQREDGCIPDVAPAFWNYYSDIVTWPAAMPFTLLMLGDHYGDWQPLENYYDNVDRWLRHIGRHFSSDGLITCDKYGDWCMPPEDLKNIHSSDPNRQTDGTLIATAYYAMICRQMALYAARSDRQSDSAYYEKEAILSATALCDRFLTVKKYTSTVPGHELYPDSTFFDNNTLTANLLGLKAMEIAPPIDADYIKGEVCKNIVRNIVVDNKDHLSCGVIGVSWLMRSLSNMGRNDVAWLLAGQTSYPSWGHMVECGATTIWELWNGHTASPKMNSGNHVMLLGDLICWLYKDILGLKKMVNSHLTIAPDFSVDEIDDIDGSLMTIYGQVSVRWKKTNNATLRVEVSIPANTTASLRMPDGAVRQLVSGSHIIETTPIRRHASIVCDEFLYARTSFPQCHSATIAETPSRDLVAAFFGGTRERNADVSIWVSVKKNGADSWSEPILAADGVFLEGSADALLAGVDTSCVAAKPTTDKPGINNYGLVKPRVEDFALNDSSNVNRRFRKACWNPVLHCHNDGRLTLFFKIGNKVSDWTAWSTVSTDGGRTWSDRKPLDDVAIAAFRNDTLPSLNACAPYRSSFAKAQLLGPVKNKIVENNGRLIAPSSVEDGGWRVFFELSDDDGRSWRKTALTAVADTSITLKAIQPTIIKLSDGRLEALCRTRNRRVAATFSNDNGETWSPLVLLDMPNNNSGIDAVTLHDGRHVMICNDWPIEPDKEKGARTPLSLLTSTNGVSWNHWLTLEDSPIGQYSYPSIIQSADGHLHCVYTWRRKRIKHVEIKL